MEKADVTGLREELEKANLKLDGSCKVLVDHLLTYRNTAKQRVELERQKKTGEATGRSLDTARMRRSEKRVKDMAQNWRNNDGAGVGSNSLHQTIENVFRKYWDMEFPNLGGENPFRIVIDRKSAARIAPDYFNVIKTPMNLTYIKDKVKGQKYTTLTGFFVDIDLMISNALKYNVGEADPYRIASEELKKKHTKKDRFSCKAKFLTSHTKHWIGTRLEFEGGHASKFYQMIKENPPLVLLGDSGPHVVRCRYVPRGIRHPRPTRTSTGFHHQQRKWRQRNHHHHQQRHHHCQQQHDSGPLCQ